MKKKTLLLSILSIIMCLSLTVGGTFALFTSKSEVNVAVTSGTVNVTAEVKSYVTGTTLGGDAYVQVSDNQDGSYALATMVAGDYVDFVIDIANNSDVSVKYRIVTKLQGDLANDLVVTITDQNDSVLANTGYTDWILVDADVDNLGTYTIKIAIPEENETANGAKEGNVYFAVEAIQGNATVVNPVMVDEDGAYVINNNEGADLINYLLNNANDEEVVLKIADDVEVDQPIVIPEDVEVTIDLGGKALSGSILAPSANLTIENGELKNEDRDVSAIEINAGTLTLTDVEISSARHAVRIDGDVTATIDGGIYKAAAYEGTGTYHAVNVSGNANVTINGGNFIGPKGTIADSGSAVNAQAGSTVTINGGRFSGGKNNTLSAKGTLIVKGGTFDQDPSNQGGKSYVAEGYKVVKASETYLVKEAEKVVEVSIPAEATQDEVNKAFADAAKQEGATVVLPAATYTKIPTLKKGQTIVGEEGVVFNDTLSGILDSVTLDNIEIKADNAQRWAYAEGDVVFENCTFEATSVYAIHYDGLTNANVVYKNCTIIGWAAIGHGAEHITFDGCTIKGNGSYGLIRVYSPATIINCTFDVANVNTEDVYQDGIHAVNCTIYVANNVNVNGEMKDIYNVSGTGEIIEM